MANCFLAPDPIQSKQFIPGGAVPANGGLLFFYVTGTATKTTVYAGPTTLYTAWSNPIVLDSGGDLPSGGEVWIPEGVTVKVVLAPANDTDPPASPYWTRERISGINDVTFGSSEWVDGTTPTFLSATSLRVSGDQRATYSAGQRIKALNTAGTTFAMVSSAVLASGSTTIGINTTNAFVPLDAGLSVLQYSLLNAVDPSVPMLLDNAPFMADKLDRSKTLATRMQGLTTSTQRYWTVQDNDITVADINDTHGSCILTATSSQITLLPYNGNKIIINGTSCSIATSGVSIGTSVTTLEGGVTNTNVVYYLYAGASTGAFDVVTHLRPSVSSAVLQNSTGIFIRSGDPTATLVGMYMLTSTFPGQFVDSVTTSRFVRSWFNDRGINVKKNFTTNTNGGDVTYAEIAAYTRPLWLQWANEIVRVSAMGGFGTSLSSTQIFAALGVDSSTVPYDTFCMLQGSAWQIYPLALSINVAGLSEGLHFASLMCKNGGGAVAGISGDTVSSQATSIQVYVHK